MELSELVALLRSEYDKHKEMKAETAEQWHKVEALELQLRQRLEEMDTIQYQKVSKDLKVKFKIEARAKIPKTPEDKEAFMQWLRDKDIYDLYVTVNSQSINSLVKQERALDPDLVIPGLTIEETIKVDY